MSMRPKLYVIQLEYEKPVYKRIGWLSAQNFDIPSKSDIAHVDSRGS